MVNSSLTVNTDHSCDSINAEQEMADDSSTDLSIRVFLYDENACMHSNISSVSDSATIKPLNHCNNQYQRLPPS